MQCQQYILSIKHTQWNKKEQSMSNYLGTYYIRRQYMRRTIIYTSKFKRKYVNEAYLNKHLSNAVPEYNK